MSQNTLTFIAESAFKHYEKGRLSKEALVRMLEDLINLAASENASFPERNHGR